MRPTVLIVHGAGGFPDKNWFPWLAKECDGFGCRVFVPAFPTPEGQSLDEWRAVLEPLLGEIGDRPIVVGHSLGVPFLLAVLEKLPVRAAFLVAGFTGPIPHPINETLKTFTYREFDWDAIKKNCPRFFVFNSDNDPYVPLAKGEELAKHLGTRVILVKGGGHLNESSGYKAFPLLFEKLKGSL